MFSKNRVLRDFYNCQRIHEYKGVVIPVGGRLIICVDFEKSKDTNTTFFRSGLKIDGIQSHTLVANRYVRRMCSSSSIPLHLLHLESVVMPLRTIFYPTDFIQVAVLCVLISRRNYVVLVLS